MSPVRPDRLLRELAALWVSLGREHQEGDGQGVLRACTMTLFVLADEADDPSAIWETMAALMPDHPARAVLVRLARGTGRALEARVFAQCWLPFGQRRQICCEQIEISASDAALADLPPVILPLAVPDLPVVVWCRCPRTFASPELPRICAAAGKIVVDSRAMGDARAVLPTLAARALAGPALADLAWTGLTRWRELVSRVFENRSYLEGLPGASEVSIAFTGDQPPTPAWYLAAWLEAGLRQAGGAARHRFEPLAGEPAGEIRRVAFRGAGSEISIAFTAAGCAESRTGETVSRMALPPASDYTLLKEELGIPGRDPIYEKTLSAAARLAVS